MDFIDLKTQYKNLKEEIDSGIQNVLNHGQYIMGPEVETLEKNLSKFVDNFVIVEISHLFSFGS